MSSNFKIDPDYVDVAERIREFKAAYPDGTLQPVDHDNPYIVQEVAGETVIVYRAAAYRTPDDPRPGIGVASEPYPGRTPYTKGSEIQNAETSAWGRAIVALGIPTKRVASSDEVRNRKAEQAERPSRQTRRDEQAETPQPSPIDAAGGQITKTQAKQLHEMLYAKGRESSWFLKVLHEKKGIGDGEHLTSLPADQYESLIAIVVGFADPEPTEKPQEPVSGPSKQEPGEEPPGMDAAAYKASRAIPDETPNARKGTVTAPQLTRLGAICADLESEGLGRDEWRLWLWEHEKVASRTELTKAAATRAIDHFTKWITDLRALGEVVS